MRHERTPDAEPTPTGVRQIRMAEPLDAGVVDDGGVGEPCAGPNPDPAPGVYWEQTSKDDAGLWVGPMAGPYGIEDLTFIPEAELAKSFAQWVDVTLSVTPIVGQIKDVVEAVTGHNYITGEDLDGFDRALAVIGALGAIGEATTKFAKGAAALDGAVIDAVEVARQADAVREASEGWTRSDATLRFLDALDTANETIRAAEAANGGGLGRILSDVGQIDTLADWKGLVATVAGAVVPDPEGQPDLDDGGSPSDQSDGGDQPSEDDGGAAAPVTPHPPRAATDEDTDFDMEAEARAQEAALQSDVEAQTYDMRRDVPPDSDQAASAPPDPATGRAAEMCYLDDTDDSDDEETQGGGERDRGDQDPGAHEMSYLDDDRDFRGGEEMSYLDDNESRGEQATHLDVVTDEAPSEGDGQDESGGAEGAVVVGGP